MMQFTPPLNPLPIHGEGTCNAIMDRLSPPLHSKRQAQLLVKPMTRSRAAVVERGPGVRLISDAPYPHR
jgi:hypothetical protein